MSTFAIVVGVLASLSMLYVVARVIMVAYFRSKYEYVQTVMKDLGGKDDH